MTDEPRTLVRPATACPLIPASSPLTHPPAPAVLLLLPLPLLLLLLQAFGVFLAAGSFLQCGR